jgi:Transposase DDE domain
MDLDLSCASAPDATTLMGFRHLLEAHDLTKAMLVEINAMLIERGLLMSQGTPVDATLIAAPNFTKNKEHARDSEMHQTKKGNQWHFGMKAHIGVDKDSGLVHSIQQRPTSATSAKPRRCCTGRRVMCGQMPATSAWTSGVICKRRSNRPHMRSKNAESCKKSVATFVKFHRARIEMFVVFVDRRKLI